MFKKKTKDSTKSI